MKILPLLVLLAGCVTTQQVDDRITNAQLRKQITALEARNQIVERRLELAMYALKLTLIERNALAKECRKFET